MPRTALQMPQKLAESAFELFARHGFKSVSVEQIAEHAGVTKGSFYSHYGSKQEIILAACSHYYRCYLRRTQTAIATLIDPLQRLRRTLELTVRTCVIDDRNRVFTTEVFALSLHDPTVRTTWAQFYDSVREMYVGLVCAAQAAGQLPLEEARPVVELMLAAIEGVKMRAALEPHISGPEEQQEIVDGLLAFLRVAPAVSPRRRPSRRQRAS
jgi:AcrR family transcriptional regulator